jgi:hypothetical protein
MESDDFDRYRSAIEWLKIDTVKVDRSFVNRIGRESKGPKCAT